MVEWEYWKKFAEHVHTTLADQKCRSVGGEVFGVEGQSCGVIFSKFEQISRRPPQCRTQSTDRTHLNMKDATGDYSNRLQTLRYHHFQSQNPQNPNQIHLHIFSHY